LNLVEHRLCAWGSIVFPSELRSSLNVDENGGDNWVRGAGTGESEKATCWETNETGRRTDN